MKGNDLMESEGPFPYRPVPVEDARQLGEIYHKTQVLIWAWDQRHACQQVTTWGLSAHDEQMAKDAGASMTAGAGWPVESASGSGEAPIGEAPLNGHAHAAASSPGGLAGYRLLVWLAGNAAFARAQREALKARVIFAKPHEDVVRLACLTAAQQGMRALAADPDREHFIAAIRAENSELGFTL